MIVLRLSVSTAVVLAEGRVGRLLALALVFVVAVASVVEVAVSVVTLVSYELGFAILVYVAV